MYYRQDFKKYVYHLQEIMIFFISFKKLSKWQECIWILSHQNKFSFKSNRKHTFFPFTFTKKKQLDHNINAKVCNKIHSNFALEHYYTEILQQKIKHKQIIS